ncbi:hypothetical protein OAF37_00690 [Rubripirellula sp.]|nr:hypothetical protein [Rubripirellula sp.]MDB4624906.1 hypothetical protein [Rubripirellula sp.]MDB4644549.1 hypothetical protein [Rubripirellula sp.]
MHVEWLVTITGTMSAVGVALIVEFAIRDFGYRLEVVQKPQVFNFYALDD